MDLVDSMAGFKGILAGQYDDLPEGAFYMVGDMKEVAEKAKKMAEEASKSN